MTSTPTTARPLPAYEAPRRALALFAIDLLLGRRRSFAKDSVTMMEANPYPRRLEGTEHVPRGGTFIIVMNHLSRDGLRPYHCAMAVTDVVTELRPGQPEVCWAFTSEYLGRHVGPVPIPLFLIRWLFRRVAKVYDLVILPRREALVMGRAVALRRLAATLATRPVGLTPEGTGARGRLVVPPPGVGLFLATLARRTTPVLPVAAWEDDGALVIRFGEQFRLEIEPRLPRDQQDEIARTRVMVAIGRLMPRAYWGAYEAQIAAS